MVDCIRPAEPYIPVDRFPVLGWERVGRRGVDTIGFNPGLLGVVHATDSRIVLPISGLGGRVSLSPCFCGCRRRGGGRAEWGDSWKVFRGPIVPFKLSVVL